MSLTIGIDSGSSATKGILFDHREGGRIVRRFLVPTPFRPLAAIEQGWETLSAALPERPHLTLTGYGRDLASFADRRVTEISCHGLGARLLCPSVHTVIDIGGQDSKVIQLDGEGNLTDFLMNDKCAAGTGRFLEVITRTLGARVEQLDELLQGRAPRHQQHVYRVCRIGGDQPALGGHSGRVDPGRHRPLHGPAQCQLHRPSRRQTDCALYRRRQPLRHLPPLSGARIGLRCGHPP